MEPPAIKLELAAGRPVDNRLGLDVPALVLTIHNPGPAGVEIPADGLPMLLALRTHLARGADRVVRSAGTGKPVAPRTRTLAAGASVEVTVSPLDDGPGESPLDAGTWTASICLGETCSNEIELAVVAR